MPALSPFTTLGALALLALAAAPAQELAVPANDGWVTDLAGMLSADEERALEALMESYRAGSGQDVALLTVPDLGGRPVEDYARAVARTWKLGDRETSAGALLVVAREERAVRIEVGRGLEGALPDVIAGRIVRDVIVPEFRAGRFGAGLRLGVEAIHAAAGGDYAPLERGRGSDGPPEVCALGFGLLFFWIVARVMRSVRRGTRGRGGSGSVLPWILASQMGRSSGGRIGGFSGGSFGGGGGGFGGFGGGGGFSGGGASGRW